MDNERAAAMSEVMRVAILSDTHGRIDHRVLEVASACDLAVHGGDIGCAAVLDRLAEGLAPRGGRVLAVLGNNDCAAKWPAPDRERLLALPHELLEPLPGGTLAAVHGDRLPARDRHRRLRALYPSVRVLIYGHSHRLVVDVDGLPWILNPGAAGNSRTFGGPSCLVLVAGNGAWKVEIHRFATLSQPAPRGPGERRKGALIPLIKKH